MVAAGTTVSRCAERAGFWIYLEARASRICKCPKCGKRRKRTPMACRCRATVMAREQPRGTSRKPGLNGVCRLMLYNTKACLHVSLCAQPSLRSEPLRTPLLGALPLPSPEAATTPTSATTRLDITATQAGSLARGFSRPTCCRGDHISPSLCPISLGIRRAFTHPDCCMIHSENTRQLRPRCTP